MFSPCQKHESLPFKLHDTVRLVATYLVALMSMAGLIGSENKVVAIRGERKEVVALSLSLGLHKREAAIS